MASTFFPFGTEVLLYAAIQVMGGSYWGGVLLTYVWTTAFILSGFMILAKPHWFYRPAGIVLMIILIVSMILLTIGFAGGNI